MLKKNPKKQALKRAAHRCTTFRQWMQRLAAFSSACRDEENPSGQVRRHWTNPRPIASLIPATCSRQLSVAYCVFLGGLEGGRVRDGRVRGEGENRASSWRVAGIKAERCWLAEEGRESQADERATDQTGDKRCERDVS